MMKQYKLMNEFDNNKLDRDHEHPGDTIWDCLRLDILQPSESMGYIMKLNGTVAQKIYYMSELDEVLGPLNAIEECEGGIVALIGKIPVYLPSELTVKLQCLIGRRVGVLRLEGYRVRAF
jgi:hypothetical protein